ncbi:restriction endonuclease subunit S [Mycoplasma wenyonii]|uniref:Restriction endonuclease subunit S n=1 Tax=Mycoplasma wenyonii TaxID=65123 RepID=A0A328PSU2_9MOLU|nr:restriction endonuclease subunit S [Mycoplasma wenyonii]RAO94810.1 restriction endonuclease subunit S [Mycoplasma wenyonii]
MSNSGIIVAPLGNYITLVTRKNKNLESTNLIGLSMITGIIEASKKVSESYLRSGWLAQQGDFMIDLVNIQNNSHLAVDINRAQKMMVISEIYKVFRMTNPQLNSEYLLLILKNSIMELRLKWACLGSVRGVLPWKNFVNIPVAVPSLNKQERIVYKYQTITKYIELKKKINELFEKQMTAYYYILFDSLTDYTIKNFGELFTIIRGGRPPRGNKEQEKKYFCREGGVPWLQVRDISKKNCKFVGETSDQLTPEGFKKGRCTMLGGGTLSLLKMPLELWLAKFLLLVKKLVSTFIGEHWDTMN